MTKIRRTRTNPHKIHDVLTFRQHSGVTPANERLKLAGKHKVLSVNAKRSRRYLDPKYSRWMSTDPALQDYIPLAPTDDEAKRHNENLPGMGGVYNLANLNLYHYSANNPLKYKDPDGCQTLPNPGVEALNSFLKDVQLKNEVAEGIGSNFLENMQNNNLAKAIDKVFNGGKFAEAAQKFKMKVNHDFMDVKATLKSDLIASKEIMPDKNGKFSKEAARKYASMVNSTMTLNYSDQSSLGPYEGDVEIPFLSDEDALAELNGLTPQLKTPDLTKPPVPNENQ